MTYCARQQTRHEAGAKGLCTTCSLGSPADFYSQGYVSLLSSGTIMPTALGIMLLVNMFLCGRQRTRHKVGASILCGSIIFRQRN